MKKKSKSKKRSYTRRDDPQRAKCKSCGFKIRGKNHEQGDHHNGKVPSCGRN